MTRILPAILLVLAPAFFGAQEPPPRPAPIAVSGEVGTSAESYVRRGRQALRPQSTGEVYLRSNITLFGRLSTDVDLLYSTADGANAAGGPGFGRQQLNRLGIAPAWSWGKVYLGSFTDTYSQYTFGGVRVNGAGFAINPGLLRLATAYGLTERSVLGGATDGSFRRRILSGRVGVGRGVSTAEGGSYFDLTLLRAWDDVGALGAAASESGIDGLPVNPLAVTPQENVVLGANGALELMQGRLRLAGEASAAAHSRDRRAPELDESVTPSYPRLMRSLLTPRISSHADHAYRFDARYRLPSLPGSTPTRPRVMDVAAEVSRIGPGYVSLGIASLPTDQQAFGLRTQVRFPAWTLGLTGRLQQDNLVGQKLHTTERGQYGATFTVRPHRRWTASLRGMVLGVGNGADDLTRRIDYSSRMLNTSHSIAREGAGTFRSVNLSYGYRDAGDSDPSRAASALVAHNADVRLAFSPNRVLHLSPSVGLVRARTGTSEWSTRESYSLTTTARLLDGRWSSTLALGASRAAPTRSTRASLSSQFRISDLQDVSLTLSAQQARSPLEGGAEVQEYVTYLRLVRRFP